MGISKQRGDHQQVWVFERLCWYCFGYAQALGALADASELTES
ncbi:MAG: hypothetical protein AAGB51_01200 [Planctomycetota bacterium]